MEAHLFVAQRRGLGAGAGAELMPVPVPDPAATTKATCKRSDVHIVRQLGASI